jgi:pectate lyase
MKLKQFSLAIAVMAVMLAAIIGTTSNAQAQTVCSPATAISVPFTKDGGGTFCYQASSLCANINSWNMNALSINGTNYTNMFVFSSSIAPLNGGYTITYNGTQFGHFEIVGSPCSTSSGPTATRTRTPTQGTGPTATRTRTPTLGGPTATRTRTPTRTNTPFGPTATRTRTPTQGSVSTTGQVGYSTQNGGTTGGAGGTTVTASTGTQIHQAICGRASNTTPIIIRVSGTITVGNTAKVSGSCNTADGVIEIKDVSNISIIGVGTSAIFDQIGIHVRNSHNIIIQNVNVKNVKKSGTPISNGGDAIGMESSVSNVWVDHCLLEASGGEAEGYDGLFDVKANTQYVTLSWSILRNSERGGLVNSSDSDLSSGFITYHHNYYQNLHSRLPLLRGGTAHSFNNYFNGIVESGMNPRIGGKIKAQNNYFENALNPIGTFYTDDMGFWDVSGNIFTSTVSWSAPGTDMHPAGPNVVSTTSISIPYAYTLDAAANVPSIVLNGAGIGKIGN